MVDKETYVEKQRKRISKRSIKKYQPGFSSTEALSTWYCNQLEKQDFKCEYCEISIFDLSELINQGKLKTRKSGKGYRGPVLEIDKKINDQGYSPENCVLACYYCNNDKSYIFDDKDYKNFLAKSHKVYFEHLLNRR